MLGTWGGGDLAAHNRSAVLPAGDDDSPLWTVWLVPAAWVPPSQRMSSAKKPVEEGAANSAKWPETMQHGTDGDRLKMMPDCSPIYATVNGCQFL